MRLRKTMTLGFCLILAAASVLSAQGFPGGSTGSAPSSPATTPAPAPAPAPVPAVPAANADARLIAFGLGVNGGLKLGPNSGTIGTLFAMDLTITDSFSMGLLTSVSGGTTYNLVKLAYHLTPALGFDVYVGADVVGAATATAGGLGVFYTVLKSKPDSGLATGLKLHLDYLMDTSAGFAKGDFVLGVISYFGL